MDVSIKTPPSSPPTLLPADELIEPADADVLDVFDDRLLLLDSHTLDCIEKSYNFNISEGQAIGLYVENGVLYILGDTHTPGYQAYCWLQILLWLRTQLLLVALQDSVQ